jgi:hypothetical protein
MNVVSPPFFPQDPWDKAKNAKTRAINAIDMRFKKIPLLLSFHYGHYLCLSGRFGRPGRLDRGVIIYSQ